MNRTQRTLCIGMGLIALAAGALAIAPVRRMLQPVALMVTGKRTVADRLQEFTAARARVRASCATAGVAYPPERVVLVGLKQERRLEVYAGPRDGTLRHIADYAIVAASGELGPKLREGDRQVPEGVYALESLNPNSRFHAALRVGYPNDLDAALARQEGRTRLGGDIMIHGGAASIGCLAMGDPAAEDLFVLTAETGLDCVTILLSPVDLRTAPLPANLKGLHSDRYAALAAELARLPR